MSMPMRRLHAGALILQYTTFVVRAEFLFTSAFHPVIYTILVRANSTRRRISVETLKMAVESSFVRLFYDDVTIYRTDAEQMKSQLGENTSRKVM